MSVENQEQHYFGGAEINGHIDIVAVKPNARPGMRDGHISDLARTELDLIDFARLATATRTFEDDLNACCAANDSLFRTIKSQLLSTLSTAFPLYLHLVAGGKEAWSKARENAAFKTRQRGLKSGTEALTAVLIVSNPKDKGDRKTCSDYATMLVWAAANRVEPGRFVEQMQEVTIKECRAFARDLRKRNRRSKDEADSSDAGASVNDVAVTNSNAVSDLTASRPTMKFTIITEAGAEKSISWGLDPKHAVALLSVFGREKPFTSDLHILGELQSAIRHSDRQDPFGISESAG